MPTRKKLVPSSTNNPPNDSASSSFYAFEKIYFLRRAIVNCRDIVVKKFRIWVELHCLIGVEVYAN